MSFIKPTVLHFTQSTSPDTVANRVRIVVAGSGVPPQAAPFDEVPKPTPDPDGLSRITQAQLPKIAGLEGRFDIYITAVDARGNESDYLKVANANLDLGAPTAPTNGAIE